MIFNNQFRIWIVENFTKTNIAKLFIPSLWQSSPKNVCDPACRVLSQQIFIFLFFWLIFRCFNNLSRDSNILMLPRYNFLILLNIIKRWVIIMIFHKSTFEFEMCVAYDLILTGSASIFKIIISSSSKIVT